MKRIMMVLLAGLLLIGSAWPVLGTEVPSRETVALHIGSPLIMEGESVKPLDPENPNVVPVIHKDRTLVPLRALSEHFGAQVAYDASRREALVSFGDKTYAFPIGKSFYRIEASGAEDRTVSYDTEALILEDRTMVPLRVICEEVLGKSVGYGDRVVTIGDGAVDPDEETIEGVKARIGQALKVASVEELGELLGAMASEGLEKTYREAVPAMDEAGEAQNEEVSSDFSATNEQVEGVNEADVVKTDGRFIYVAAGDTVRVYEANAGKPVLTDKLSVEVDPDTGEYIRFTELYIDEGRLVVLGVKSGFDNWIRPLPEDGAETSFLPYWRDRSGMVWCGIYAVDEDGRLEELRQVEVEGSLLSSRKKDGTVYLVVNKYVYSYGIDPLETLPVVRDTAVDPGHRALPLDSLFHYPGRMAANYLMLAAVDVMDSEAPANVQAFLGSGDLVYMSRNALYVAGQTYSPNWGSVTNIAKFTVDGTKIGFAGGGLVEGHILNQFSMDEYEGNLRVATTNWRRESVNAVTVLDESLRQVGAVENLAPGERIYSVRFMGDKGYVVTFRQIDPLFVLDLSNPESPKVTGELKVPGFSNYLHPLGSEALLGIGQDVDEKTGIQQGIKLSVFDVSDEGKPRESGNLVLGGSGSYAEVLNNHKALMLNPGRNLIAFDASLSSVSGDYEKSVFYGAVVVRVETDGDMEVLGRLSNGGRYGTYVRRLLYIGDVLYYVLDEDILTYDLETLEPIG